MYEQIKMLRGEFLEVLSRRRARPPAPIHEGGGQGGHFRADAGRTLLVTSPRHHMTALGLRLGRVLRSTFEYRERNLDLDLKAVDLHREFWYGGVIRCGGRVPERWSTASWCTW